MSRQPAETILLSKRFTALTHSLSVYRRHPPHSKHFPRTNTGRKFSRHPVRCLVMALTAAAVGTRTSRCQNNITTVVVVLSMWSVVGCLPLVGSVLYRRSVAQDAFFPNGSNVSQRAQFRLNARLKSESVGSHLHHRCGALSESVVQHLWFVFFFCAREGCSTASSVGVGEVRRVASLGGWLCCGEDADGAGMPNSSERVSSG